MGAEAARGCKGGAVFSEVVDAAVAFTKLADAQEAVAVERRVAVAAEARCCRVRALPAAAGLDLSCSWGLLFNKRCGIFAVSYTHLTLPTTPYV